MTIKHQQNKEDGCFIASESELRAGMMSYTLKNKTIMVIKHTEVDEAFRGKGVGIVLLNKVVDFVRKNKIKVIPECPYAKRQFDKNELIRDVLLKEE